jgi:putative membrane protein
MIRNFSDHAANERTFLAWVRTSIAVIAFGFLVERFDLFVAFARVEIGGNRIRVPQDEFGQVAGLVLIVLGMAMILVAALRFARNAREIDADTTFPGTGSRVDLALAFLILLLAGALLFYLGSTLSVRA